ACGGQRTRLHYQEGEWTLDGTDLPLMGNTLHKVWINPSGQHGMMVGDTGMMIVLEEGEWKAHPQSSLLTRYTMYGLWISSDGTQGWISGENGLLVHLMGQ
ncbi:MAG TPA: hypothetical protein DCR93_39145, partial [Cytophagales bacterium]|nr:hypothetical protein [Cytophagales bacterium]